MVISDDEPEVKLPKGKRMFFMGILYSLFVVDFIARIGINAIFPVIQSDLALSDSEVGILGGVVLLGMSAFVLPISYLGEKWSTKKTITLSALIWSVGSILSGAAKNFTVLAISRFGVGVGNAAYAPLSVSTVTSWYGKSQWGKVLGLYNTAMTVGMALGAIVFAAIADQFGWRAAFYGIGIISLILTAMSLLIPEGKKKDANAEEKVKISMKDAFKVIAKNKSLIRMCIGAGFACMALNGINGWASIYYVRTMGMSVTEAAALISLSSLLAIVGYPVGGFLLDKFYVKDKKSRLWLPAIFVACSGLICMAGFYFQVVPLILCGTLFFALGNTAFHACTQELVPSWYKSVSYGTYVVFIQFLGALGPVAVGLLSEAFGIELALTVIQILLLVGSVALLWASRTYITDYDRSRAQEKAAGM